MDNFVCFEPVVDKNSKILILGSFPSVKSREINFYYGNKQNKIWKIFENFFKEKIGENIENKKAFLLSHKIAMWDIVKSSNIKGSSDSDILKNNYEINDILKLLKKYPNIKNIYCNGKLSYNLTLKYFPNLKVNYLPSTSPANVSFKLEPWNKALESIR